MNWRKLIIRNKNNQQLKLSTDNLLGEERTIAVTQHKKWFIV